jgi:hypothetical protein
VNVGNIIGKIYDMNFLKEQGWEIVTEGTQTHRNEFNSLDEAQKYKAYYTKCGVDCNIAETTSVVKCVNIHCD